MIELVEVAEGVLEPQITSGPIQIVNETCFKCSFLVKDSLLVLHMEVDFEGAVKVPYRPT